MELESKDRVRVTTHLQAAAIHWWPLVSYHTMAWYTYRFAVSILLVVAIISYSLAFTSHTHQYRQPHHIHQLLSAITNTRGGDIQDDQPTAPSMQPSTPSDTITYISPLEELLSKAQTHLSNKDADGAFNILAQAFGIDPTSSQVSSLFEQCLSLKVELAEESYYTWKDSLSVSSTSNQVVDSSDDSVVFSEQQLNELFQDRMGLATLYIDREYYDEAGRQLRLAIEEVTYWLNHHIYSAESQSTQTSAAIDFSSSAQFPHWQPQIDRAQYLLYRTNAACCQWETYFLDGDRVRQSLLLHGGQTTTQTLVHPFDALKFPCISLELASSVAQSYANRALETVGADTSSKTTNNTPRRRIVTVNRKDTKHNHHPSKKIRIGYISPDFTSKHPLAFLMQHVFRCHDKDRITVNIYSVSSSTMEDNGLEVHEIRESSDQFTYLSPSTMSPMEMYQRILDDEVDILVDLCGYAGTSVVSEIMASRCRLKQEASPPTQPRQRTHFPIHVSYMGFPGSVGSSSVWDYSVFDPIVIPPEEEYGIRQHYKEALVYMPHCYFVNSHKSVIGGREDGIMVANEDEKTELRRKYGIDPSAFVYCCHSRPDKIDPSTFRSWMSALSRVRSADTSRPPPVLWLLRSGDEMELNLRQWVCQEFGKETEDCLVFADVADRNEHLRRLGIADVFLDTPAYNAHTLGCGKSLVVCLSCLTSSLILTADDYGLPLDALYMGVPMISLLLRDDSSELEPAAADGDTSNANNIETRSISTDKLASRVGASLLNAIGLDDLIYPTMTEYEEGMIRCALDEEWFSALCQQLEATKDTSALFDTKRWLENLESAFVSMIVIEEDIGDSSQCYPDIMVNDNTDDRG